MSEKENNLSLSIVMPALNEEKNIEAAIQNTLQAFGTFEIQGEIVVINDGSNDKTKELTEELMKKDNRIQMISHDTAQGIGASFWDGVDHAKGEVICMLPGDNENDPVEIFRYYGLLKNVDIVIPFVFNKKVRSLFRNTLSFIYRLLINITFSTNLNYTNGTALYRKSILRELPYRSLGFFFQTDILIRLIKEGYLFAEVPYRLETRNDGVSKAVSFPSFMQVVKGYFRLLKDDHFHRKRKSKYSEGTVTSKRKRN